jgi:hypothetical protein
MSVVAFLDHLFPHPDFEKDCTASDWLKLMNVFAAVHWLLGLPQLGFQGIIAENG